MALSFICPADNSMTIHFPGKRCRLVSTTRVIWMRNQEAE
jgi:hypothetical protein